MSFHYRWFDREQEKFDEMGIPLTRAEIDAHERKKETECLFSRGEQTGIVLTALIFAYGWTQDDLSLIFFCLSFLIFELRKIAAYFSSAYGRDIANVMRGFSLSLLLGAFVLLFMT